MTKKKQELAILMIKVSLATKQKILKKCIEKRNIPMQWLLRNVIEDEANRWYPDRMAGNSSVDEYIEDYPDPEDEPNFAPPAPLDGKTAAQKKAETDDKIPLFT